MDFGLLFSIHDKQCHKLKLQSYNLIACQKGLIISFKLTEKITNTDNYINTIFYLFSNIKNICIFNVSFEINDKIINPILYPISDLKDRQQNFHTNESQKLPNDLYGIELGTLNPNQTGKLILEFAIIAQPMNSHSFCLNLFLFDSLSNYNFDDDSYFDLKIQCQNDIFQNVESNCTGTFDSQKSEFNIFQKIQDILNNKSLFIQFESKYPIENQLIISNYNDRYDLCLFSPFSLLDSPISYDKGEFIIIADCSYAINEQQIENTKEYLEIFLRSLPENSFFNIYLLGKNYLGLFDKSESYNDSNFEKAMEFINNIEENLGKPDLFNLLNPIFSFQIDTKRMIFIISNRKINDDRILPLVSDNHTNNQCFVIGHNNNFDIIQRIALKTNGLYQIIENNDAITKYLIDFLHIAIQTSYDDMSFKFISNSHECTIEKNCAYEYNPCLYFYLLDKTQFNLFDETKMRIEFKIGNETMNIDLNNIDYQNQLNICPLFLFYTMQNYTNNELIETSTKNRVLTHDTIFDGATKISISYQPKTDFRQAMRSSELFREMYEDDKPGCLMCCCLASRNCCKKQKILSILKFPLTFLQFLFLIIINLFKWMLNLICKPFMHKESPNCKETINKTKLKMTDLLKYHNLCGSWSNLNDLNMLLNTEIYQIDGIVNDEEVISTILGLAGLYCNFEDQKQEWKLIETKSINWLKKKDQNIDFNSIINQMRSKIVFK